MNYNNLCVFDFETSSKFSSVAQILSIGSVMLNPRNLEIMDTFDILVQPSDWSTVEEEALRINKLTREELESATEPQVAWNAFTNWVNKFNKSKGALSSYNAPVPCGYNILGYDMPIVRRYAKQFGPWDETRLDQKLFNQVASFDLYQHMWYWMEANADLKSLQLSEVANWMGFDKEALATAHTSMGDVMFCVKIIQKLFSLSRRLTTPNHEGTVILSMKGAFSKKTVEG